MKRQLLIVCISLSLLTPLVVATSHYSFEHSKEMLESGRVNWHDYGPQAFEKAVTQDKPVFMVLTAPSWCYWCHVYMSSDYVYHSRVYPVINEETIPVRVNADKRQDLTRQYLEGGWPSTTVMAPNGERLYGYSGPRAPQNMIANIKKAARYVERNNFANRVSRDYEKQNASTPDRGTVRNVINAYALTIRSSFDPKHGGFGRGQKFPQGRSLDYALDVYERTGKEQFLHIVETTLRNQYTNVTEVHDNYNLYDPIEGAFHRYGTERDWTPPHYEKMLYTNAKLLRAYNHLLQIQPGNDVAREVVNGTLAYMQRHWYDTDEGGFYGNTDVGGEGHYYKNASRPGPVPHVEKTKYTDWNAQAIKTYLELWETTGDEQYRTMANQSLQFFTDEMITDDGAVYHYQESNGTKAVRGNLLDNAYMLLALTEGNDVLGEERYLHAARSVANYTLNTLYDWYGGGFFERNSPNKELYAPGEYVLLSKPTELNGVMAYAMLKLYQQTDNPMYLDAGLKTFADQAGSVGGLDRAYYYAKAAELIRENDLLAKHAQAEQRLQSTVRERRKNYWLNDVIQQASNNVPEFEPTTKATKQLDGPLLLLVIVALLAGFISFASPCTLPILPAYVAYSLETEKQNQIGMTTAFFAGLALTFTLIGMTATAVGSFLDANTAVFSKVTGALIMLFGAYILTGRGFGGVDVEAQSPTSYLGGFLFGATLGISWTPCVGPILVAITLMASTTGSVLTGGLLLFTYAVGLAVPLLFVSTYIERVDKESALWNMIQGRELQFSVLGYEWNVHRNTLISGVLFFVLGFLIYTGALYTFNQYVAASGFQQWLFSVEEWLLDLVR